MELLLVVKLKFILNHPEIKPPPKILAELGLTKDFQETQIRKNIQSRESDIIEYEQELRELFEKFPSQNHRNLRDKVMLGLFIFQGVNTGTLRALKIQDVHLEKGSVYLPSLKRSNARNLPLNPAQILSLNQYLVDVRPFLEGNSEPLILGNMSNLLTLLLAKLQTINPNVLFIRQLRTSVIVDWLREYNLREVQYFAGHRNITTTEEYLMQDVGKLKKTLGDFHPLR